jgi:hypothetical protein
MPSASFRADGNDGDSDHGGWLAKVRRLWRFLTPNQNEHQDTHGDHQYAANPNQFNRHSMPPQIRILRQCLNSLLGVGVLVLLGTSPLRVIRLDSHAPAKIDKRGWRFPGNFPARKRLAERILGPTPL